LSSKIRGVLFGIRIVVFDKDAARSLYKTGYYGKPLGVSKPSDVEFSAPLELGIMEALYLTEKGNLCVTALNEESRCMSEDELRAHGEKVMERFEVLYRVYRDLRDHGYVVRSGLKYGADFAVYEKGPGIEHAPYLVHVATPDQSINPLDIVRAGRLSHSVRKDFILAIVYPAGRISYLVFAWSKP